MALTRKELTDLATEGINAVNDLEKEQFRDHITHLFSQQWRQLWQRQENRQ